MKRLMNPGAQVCTEFQQTGAKGLDDPKLCSGCIRRGQLSDELGSFRTIDYSHSLLVWSEFDAGACSREPPTHRAGDALKHVGDASGASGPPAALCVAQHVPVAPQQTTDAGEGAEGVWGLQGVQSWMSLADGGPRRRPACDAATAAVSLAHSFRPGPAAVDGSAEHDWQRQRRRSLGADLEAPRRAPQGSGGAPVAAAG